MKNYEIKKFETLSNSELISTTGGRWSPNFWVGYIVAEVLEGFQRGLTADCSEVCK